MSSVIELIKMLYTEGFFSDWQGLKEVKLELEKKGFNFSDQLINTSLNNAVRKNILSKKKISGKNRYSQKQPPEIKIKEKETKDLNKVLSEITKKKLGERFQQEIRELNIAFTYDCGTSGAFLLRKILEKMIILVLNSNSQSSLLKDSNGKSRGLEALINICSQNKIKNNFILQNQTAQKLLGIKFLGDTAAHNPIANVDLETLNPQLPYWITAVKELMINLK